MTLATVAGCGTYASTIDSSVTVGLHKSVNQVLFADTSVAARRAEELLEHLVGAFAEAARNGILANSEAASRAYSVLRALPTSLPLPSVVVEEDGDLALDWDLGPRQVVTVAVGAAPTLRYASLIGAETAYGRIPYSGEVPGTLVRLIQRVSA